MGNPPTQGSLDRLDELERLEALDRLDSLDRLDTLDQLERLEALDQLERLEALDLLGTLDQLERPEALERLGKPEAPPPYADGFSTRRCRSSAFSRSSALTRCRRDAISSFCDWRRPNRAAVMRSRMPPFSVKSRSFAAMCVVIILSTMWHNVFAQFANSSADHFSANGT